MGFAPLVFSKSSENRINFFSYNYIVIIWNMEKNMDKRDLDIVKKFRKLVSQKVKVHELRVFGSRARDDAVAESDLDILIVVDHLDYSIELYISDCAWEAGFSEDVVVMPVSISIDAMKNSPIRESVFIKKIYHEGVAV